MLLLGLAALAGPAALSQPAPASPARPLTLSVGPRDGVWKRVFNPLLYEADTRWPAAAGINEPLIVYNRATASYMPWLGAHYDWSENDKRLKFTLRPGVTWSDGVAFSARDVVFTFELLRTFPATRTSSRLRERVARSDRHAPRGNRAALEALIVALTAKVAPWGQSREVLDCT